MNLILVEPNEVSDAGELVLTGQRATHLTTVLNVVLGSTVRLGLVDGPCGLGVVSHIGDGNVRLACTFAGDRPEPPPVDLLLAMPRPKVLRRLWAQLAAVGVGRIMLTNAARVERNYFDTHLLDPDVYRPLLIEGLQQARDTRVPLVSIHRQLKVFLEDDLETRPETAHVFGDPVAGKAIATAIAPPCNRVLLAVGPEGGWTDYERHMLQRHHFEAVSLGLRSLRSDTACIALLTLVHAALTDSYRVESSAHR